MSTPRISASVALQEWHGRKKEQLVTLREVTFDATAAILRRSVPEVRQLLDSDHNTDPVVRESECPEFRAHQGPFDVTVVEAIEAFLSLHGVEGREALTDDRWEAIRAQYIPAEVRS